MISKLQNKLLPDPPDVVNKQSRLYRRIEFEFIRKIGDGAYGQVWKVRHKKSNIFFALKQVPKAKVFKMLPQFNREVSILYKLSHPHIIKLLTHFEDDKCFYLIMELIEGGTLFHKLYRERNILEARAAQYFREIVLAIEYLHSRAPPIVHRDIKPENILIDKEGRMKLIDFGWANYCDVAGSARKTYCGTSEYMPPEIIETKGHDTSADIWCLGILLYEMLVGNTPFKSQDKEKMARIITEAKVKFPLSVPPLAKELISCMLEKDSNQRINIFQIKEHSWLKQNPPIRDTVQQDYQPAKFIKYIKHESEDKKENNTDATNSSESEEEPECRFGEIPQRKSMKKLKETLAGETSESSLNKTKLQEIMKLISVEEEKCTKVEDQILSKRREMSKIAFSSKEFLSKVFDANLELEILQGEDINELAEKKRESQKKLFELGKQCKIYKLNLDNLRKEVNKESVNIANSEIQLSKLQSSLKQLQGMAKHIKSDSRSNENDLKLNISLLKQQLFEKTSVLSTFSPEELLIAKDISNTIKAKMANFASLTRDIQKKTELAEEKSIELEQSIEELKIYNEKEKSSIFQRLHVEKDKFLNSQKKSKEETRLLRKNSHAEVKKALRDEINQAVNLIFPIQNRDFDRAYDRIQVLKNMINRLEKIETRKRKDRAQMREIIENNNEIINCKV